MAMLIAWQPLNALRELGSQQQPRAKVGRMTSPVISKSHTRLMPRSQEVVRQWQILRSLATSRLGIGVQDLAVEHGVAARTIRRDLSALGRAGFPLYQEQGS